MDARAKVRRTNEYGLQQERKNQKAREKARALVEAKAEGEKREGEEQGAEEWEKEGGETRTDGDPTRSTEGVATESPSSKLKAVETAEGDSSSGSVDAKGSDIDGIIFGTLDTVRNFPTTSSVRSAAAGFDATVSSVAAVFGSTPLAYTNTAMGRMDGGGGEEDDPFSDFDDGVARNVAI